MQLKEVCRTLDQELASKETARELAQAKSRHPALKPFSTVSELRAFLRQRNPTADEKQQQEEVLLALIEEAQRRGCSCWSALLLVVHFPGLWGACRFLCRFHPPGVTMAEVNLLVIESFFEAVQGFRWPSSGGRTASTTLIAEARRLAQRHLRAEERRSKRHLPLEVLDQGRTDAELFSEPEPEEESPSPQARQARLSMKALPHFLSDDELELLLETFGSGRKLIDWLRETFGDEDPARFQQLYSQLRRRRSRLIALIRRQVRRLAEVASGGEGVCPCAA